MSQPDSEYPSFPNIEATSAEESSRSIEIGVGILCMVLGAAAWLVWAAYGRMIGHRWEDGFQLYAVIHSGIGEQSVGKAKCLKRPLPTASLLAWILGVFGHPAVAGAIVVISIGYYLWIRPTPIAVGKELKS